MAINRSLKTVVNLIKFAILLLNMGSHQICDGRVYTVQIVLNKRKETLKAC